MPAEGRRRRAHDDTDALVDLHFSRYDRSQTRTNDKNNAQVCHERRTAHHYQCKGEIRYEASSLILAAAIMSGQLYMKEKER